MGAFRNDDDLRQHRIENLEHELAQVRRELEKKDEEIAELERENRDLSRDVAPFRRCLSSELSMALACAEEANDLEVRLQAMRREVRWTRLLVMSMIAVYWFSTSGWLPF